MSDPRITAVWFTEGWGRSYANRASGYGNTMPDFEHERMMQALSRMYVSQRREDDQRVAIGKERIWSVTPKDV